MPDKAITDKWGSTGRHVDGKFAAFESQDDADGLVTNAVTTAKEVKTRNQQLEQNQPKEQNQGGDDAKTELPENFPVRQKLIDAGFDSLEDIRALSDDQLKAVNGVGDAMLAQIRAAQGQA